MALVASGKTELQNLIPTMWSTQMYDELRQSLLLGSFFMRDYEGEIRSAGDTVKVNQINAATGENLEFGVDNTLDINSEALTITQKEVKADRLATASYLVEELAQLQSLEFQAEARQSLVFAVMKQVEDHIESLMVPAAANDIAPVSASDLAVGDVAEMRRLLSKAKVPVQGRALFLDVDYHSDIIQKSQFASSDFVPAGSPTATGEFSSPIYGFSVREHNGLAADTGYGAHPSAIAHVMQREMSVKLSDMHPAGKRGWLLTAEVFFGAKLFDNTRIVRIDEIP
jgi:hypothetical protein